jgi:hypothetical protein
MDEKNSTNMQNFDVKTSWKTFSWKNWNKPEDNVNMRVGDV